MARLTHGTLGRVVDYQIADANHMGAAMAPAVADTLCAHLRDTGRSPADYGLIVTGDLELMKERGVPLEPGRLVDCGASLYNKEQDCHAGGSGCGCVASVLASHFLPMLADGRAARLLVLGSGAMLSTTSSQQGQSIPGLSYAVALEADT